MKAKLTFPNKFTAVLTLTVPQKKRKGKPVWQDGIEAMMACKEAVEYAREHDTLKEAADSLSTIHWLEWLIEKFVTPERARMKIYAGERSVRAYFTAKRCKAIEAALVKKAVFPPSPFEKGTDARLFLEETRDLAEKEEF